MTVTHCWRRQRCLFLSNVLWSTLMQSIIINNIMTTTLFVSAAHSRRRIVVRRESEPKYDRSITTFSPDGRLGQVEYAMEAALRGSTIAACHYLPNDDDDDAGICLVVDSSSSSSTTSTATTKVHRIDHHILLITAGLSGDARVFAHNLRSGCQSHRLQFGEPPTTKQVAKMAGQIQHQITRTAGRRPLGCTAFVVGIDDRSASGGSSSSSNKAGEKEESTPLLGIPRLFETDPGGIVEECQYYAVAGKGRSSLGRIVAPFVTKVLSSSKSPGRQKTSSLMADIATGLAEIVLKQISELSGSRKGDSSSTTTVDIWTIQPHATQRGGMKATCYRNISKSNLSQIKVLLSAEGEAKKK